MSSSSSQSIPQDATSYDELSMQQILLFSDSLKDLKNLRTQLYSAAEYFELSYINDDQKQIVVDTLKDYAIKALVNTVDHLGSVTYKVNELLDERVDDVSGAELRVSCIEQRIRTCQTYTDNEGLSQQLSVIPTPKYHKRYIFPVEETTHNSNHTVSRYQNLSLDDENDWHQFKNAVRATIREPPPPSLRRGRSLTPSPRPSLRPGFFSFSEKRMESPKKRAMSPLRASKRAISPLRASLPFLRSGSVSSRPTTPVSSRPTTPVLGRPTTPVSGRPTTPNSSNGRRRYPSEPRKSYSMNLHAERDNTKEVDQYSSKSKRLLKALLSRRKSKKDDTLYNYLDEY